VVFAWLDHQVAFEAWFSAIVIELRAVGLSAT
jgi:hypothetical protein